MFLRAFWINLLEQAWSKRPVVWLAGVRRVGKTYLSRALSATEYFDCELPRVRRLMEDPQEFLEGLRGRRIVLDEIHRLPNPSELLKIAADHYPESRVLATGSSTLAASVKFKDTLAGRKRDVWLTPMCLADLADANRPDLRHRLLRGGLPPFFLGESLPERDFQEWMDAYWAKDIQELFRLERRSSFQRFTELILAQSGGIFEATRFAAPCEVTRPTIANYLKVLESTFVAHVIRPFSTHRRSEIVAAPKVYGFDTGFVCYYRGWQDLRREDLGVLWEHFVLNELMAQSQSREIFYWRDVRGHEIDFVLAPRRARPLAVECKWSWGDFDAANLGAFRRQYPEGENVVVAQDVDRTFTRNYGNLSVRFERLSSVAERMATPEAGSH
jgi:predicted AAA+ superfamily ATPase